MNKHKKFRRYIITLIFVALVCVAFYDKPILRKYAVYTDLGEKGSQANFIVIADLHNTLHGENQKKIISKISNQNPDAIFLVGDMIDDFSNTENTEKLFDEITAIAPVYYVTGNHEFWTWKSDEIISLIESYKITVLRNESKAVNINTIPINICGMDDPDVISYTADEKYTSMKGAADLLSQFSDLNDDSFNILLAHRPELINLYKQYNFDLVLSGHAHGGQVRVPPFINGLYAPNQGWFPKYAGGIYKHEDMVHIVSRGLSINSLLPRVFNPPEVVCVKVISR